MTKIGLQLWTVNKQIENEGLEVVINKCKKLGYNHFEICGEEFLSNNLELLLRLKETLHVTFDAMHFGIELDENNQPTNEVDKLIDNCRKVGVKYLSVAMMPIKYGKNKQTYLEYCNILEGFSKKLIDNDIKLYYHNHHFEFAKFDGETGLDIMINNTEDIGFELDVHWVQRGGKDPVDYIKKCKDRCEILHLKDYRIDAFAYEDKFSDRIKFAEVGEGNLEIEDIIKTALDCGTKIFFVEQDDSYGEDTYELIRTSYNNLVKLGYGKYFEEEK